MQKQIKTISVVNLAQFIAEKTNINLFLTGKAGTGKTVFLKEIKEHTRKKVVVLAPTGIAAINAKAQTIHSFFKFSFSPYIPETINVNTQNDAPTHEDQILKELDMIIIDEVSMVRADLLDRIDNKLKTVRKSEKPFGGVQLLLIGDLFQLPPVVNKADKELLSSYYSSNHYFFNSKALKEVSFETISLDKVYRQSDEEFIKILDNARIGNLNWAMINKLNTRFQPDFDAEKDSRYITVVSLKRDADRINESRMGGIDGNDKVYKANISGKFPEEAYPCPLNLALKVGAQVMFTKNNYESGYRNGTIGQVSKLEEYTITVNVDGHDIIVQPTTWENIEYKLNKEIHQIQEENVGSFTQFPLKPAWAITVHKSQGLTFDNVVIDLPHTFESGQAYVAFSRCRTLEGIVLRRKVHPVTFFVDKVIVDFYNMIETNLDAIAQRVSYVPFEWEVVVEEENVDAAIDMQLAETLKNWRLALSRSLNLRAFQILTNRALNGIATVKPTNLEQLGYIHGVGLNTILKFGEDIIKIVKGDPVEVPQVEEVSQPQLTTNSANRVNHATSRTSTTQKTWEVTLEMYRSGKSVQEIANERGLSKETICNHLLRYVESGDLDAHEFVTDEIIERVRQFKFDHPDNESLRNVYEALNEEVSYEEIKFALKSL